MKKGKAAEIGRYDSREVDGRRGREVEEKRGREGECRPAESHRGGKVEKQRL